MSGSKSILKSTVIVTIVTFGIKVLGLIKQAVLAAYCGATEETDAFFIPIIDNIGTEKIG